MSAGLYGGTFGAVWLIAEREFKTYVVTPSFWIAALIGPLIALVVLAVLVGSGLPAAVSLHAENSALERHLSNALLYAARIEGHSVRFVTSSTQESVTVSRADAGHLTLQFSRGYPLSDSGRALVATTIERDLAREDSEGNLAAARVTESVDEPPRDAEAASRFAVVMILWLTLTGSLGMLLQAVARERSNRSLEVLLSAASPSQVMTGKLLGVGAVSVLVLVVWLGSAGAASIFAPKDSGSIPNLFAVLGDPALFARAAITYLLSYVFYGAMTFAAGAAARDVSTAQNLARPMFAILLVAFFASMASAGGVDLSWLLYVPPFAPFVYLASSPNALTWTQGAFGVFIFVGATAIVVRLAEQRLRVTASLSR